MACPITVSKFVGTVSLGLLTGISYSASTIAIPALAQLPTSATGSRSLSEIKRLNRKHGIRLTNIANGCLLFAYSISPRHRKHPYLIWMCVASTIGTYGMDFWFHRQAGVKAWFQAVLHDTGFWTQTAAPKQQKKEEDLVVVEAEENGESVQAEMNTERRLQQVRAVFSGLALAMGIVGLWGDRRS